MKSIFKTKEQTAAEIEREIRFLKAQQRIRYSVFMILYYVVSILFLGRTLELLFSDIPFKNFFDAFTWFHILLTVGWWTGFELLYRNWRKKRLAKQQIRLQEMQATLA